MKIFIVLNVGSKPVRLVLSAQIRNYVKDKVAIKTKRFTTFKRVSLYKLYGYCNHIQIFYYTKPYNTTHSRTFIKKIIIKMSLQDQNSIKRKELLCVQEMRSQFVSRSVFRFIIFISNELCCVGIVYAESKTNLNIYHS